MRDMRLAILVSCIVVLGAVGGFGAVSAGGSSTGAPPTSTLPAPLLAGVAKGRVEPKVKEDSVLVQFASARSLADAGSVLAEHGLERRRPTGPSGFVEVDTAGRPGARQELAADPRVRTVEPNYVRTATAAPDDTNFNQQGALVAARFPEGWAIQPSAPDVTVAVLDTGVDLDHPDLVDQLVPGTDIVGRDGVPQDENGHGTMVAGIIGATANNGRGIAGGAYRTRLQPVRVLDASGKGNDADIMEGVAWAVDHGARVINLSLGGPEPSLALAAAIANALARGVVVVAASGNASGPEPQYPAALPGVLAVAALDTGGRLAWFSSHGPWVDLAAGGVGVFSTALAPGATEAYASGNGTSFSAPLVSAAAALLRQAHPDWAPARVGTQLTSTARDSGPPGHDDGYGFGVLDVAAALGLPRLDPIPPEAGDASEPNPLPGRASVLSGTATGTIAPELDLDWFTTDVAGAGYITIVVTPPSNRGWQVMDPTIAVTAPGGAEVASVDVAGPAAPERLTFLAPAAGRYRVRVGNFNASLSDGSYRVDISSSATAPVGGPSPATALLPWVQDSDPLDGAAAVPTTGPMTVTFDRAVSSASLTAATTALLDGATLTPVDAVRSYDATSRRLTITPRAALAPGSPYQVAIAGVTDGGGSPMPGRVVVRFRTAGATPPPSSTTSSTLPPVTTPPPAPRSGYWMLGTRGTVYSFGDAANLGSGLVPSGQSATSFGVTPSGNGYWVVTSAGVVSPFGDAIDLGGVPALTPGETVTSISVHPGGKGYWLFTNRGRTFPFGTATTFGDLGGVRLDGPVLGSVATPSGNGYYMVAADGGIFAFGDARFRGSMGGRRLNAPVVGLAPDPDGLGYWLAAADGGIFAFDSVFRGSLGAIRLNQPVIGLVAFGDGYLMVAADGGIFDFSSKPFVGSLGGRPPPNPIVAVGPLDR